MKTASLRVVSDAGEGDAWQIRRGQCRLVGRHLADDRTMMMDRSGNMPLDHDETAIIEQQLRRRNEARGEVRDDLDLSEFDRGADILFDDESMSRAHAMFFVDRSGVGVIDLASTNGTFVNAERSGAVELCDGDIVQLGNTRLRVAVEE